MANGMRVVAKTVLLRMEMFMMPGSRGYGDAQPGTADEARCVGENIRRANLASCPAPPGRRPSAQNTSRSTAAPPTPARADNFRCGSLHFLGHGRDLLVSGVEPDSERKADTKDLKYGLCGGTTAQTDCGATFGR